MSLESLLSKKINKLNKHKSSSSTLPINFCLRLPCTPTTPKIWKMVGRRAGIISSAICILCSFFLPLALAAPNGGALQLGFYDNTCPRVEEIVAEVVAEGHKKNPPIAAGLLRLFVHDCFVNGCDASILLDATPSGERTERDSTLNRKNMTGMDVLDEAKARLEKECPGTVSCADTMAFATRDASVLAGVPKYPVAGGRRDGLVSLDKDTNGSTLPFPNWTAEKATELFVRKGLTQEEMVVLTGAHSIGVAHCPAFAYRVSGYNKTTQVDPKLAKADANNIRTSCLRPASVQEIEDTSLPMDIHTPFKMDNSFYRELLQGRALLESDRFLTEDPRILTIVRRLAADQKGWLNSFSKAMVRLGSMEVKTGNQGEIRRQCRFVNPPGTNSDSGNASAFAADYNNGPSSEANSSNGSDAMDSSDSMGTPDFENDYESRDSSSLANTLFGRMH